MSSLLEGVKTTENCVLLGEKHENMKRVNMRT